MTRRSIERPTYIYSPAMGGSFRPQYADEPVPPISPTKKITLVIIKTSLLIPGDGEPLEDAALVIKSKLIAWVGPQSDLPSEYTDSPHRSYSVPYLMPGLWDCHAHFGGESPDGNGGKDTYQAFITEHPAASGARLTRGCWLALQRGYTSLRDVAGMGCEVSRAIEDGTIVGPNVYSSGSGLSQLGGHGDVFSLPAGDVLLNLGVSQITAGHFGTATTMIVDGVDECRRAVRLQIRRGAKCIKVMASGGVMSRDDNPLYAQFSPAELETIVEEATRQNRVVAAHVHGKPGIMAALKAGVTTLEHVSFADRECIDLIKEKDVVYIATRVIMDLLLSTDGKGLSPAVWEKAKLCATNHLTAYKMAIESGVRIALGTDTSPGFNMAMELESAVKAGMSNLEAIKAATANGPLSVGGQAPKTGQLKVGYEADVIGLLENPAEDVKVLQKRENIGWVWKGGKIFKGPGVGPWGEDSIWGEEMLATPFLR
ncbi:Putative metal-dependent hydrolase, composite domain superfamily [Colletotrichum destructivum]|uniref:Metal-dependent hydrolase, composite domain superfamily n=1 Tax=Colletotrichum destructivum TaxID=34406 RepID=A0AAX4J407_9PEZI|nr:Putative metal-dependent hydrolase, composite domain superfamily [Colletotrichum destructivum]